MMTLKEIKRNSAIFEGLMRMHDTMEDSHGRWRIILDYDNYHDGARVLDGDENVLGECYDDEDAYERTRRSIEEAIKKHEDKEGLNKNVHE